MDWSYFSTAPSAIVGYTGASWRPTRFGSVVRTRGLHSLSAFTAADMSKAEPRGQIRWIQTPSIPQPRLELLGNHQPCHSSRLGMEISGCDKSAVIGGAAGGAGFRAREEIMPAHTYQWPTCGPRWSDLLTRTSTIRTPALLPSSYFFSHVNEHVPIGLDKTWKNDKGRTRR